MYIFWIPQFLFFLMIWHLWHYLSVRQQWFETKTSKSPIVLCTSTHLTMSLAISEIAAILTLIWNFVTVLSVGMPSIRPLETLHNALSLRQLDAFLEYVTATIFKTPCPSPRLRSPLRSNPFDFLATSYHTAVQRKVLSTHFHKRAWLAAGFWGI